MPLEYIRVMSRELERKIQGCRLYDRYINIVEGFGKLDNIIAMDLQDIISKDVSNGIHKVSTNEYSTIVSMELEVLNQQQVLTLKMVLLLVILWGVELNSVVLYPTDGGRDNGQIATRVVGVKVSSERCEIEGIIFGLEIAIKYFEYNCEETKR